MKIDTKKITILAFLLCCAVLFVKLSPTSSKKEIVVLSSFYPVHLLVQRVTKDIPGIKAVLMLSPNQGCPHDYALTVSDMKKISQADILVINGMDIEEFIHENVKKINSNIHVIDSSLGISPLYIGKSKNPHIWISPLNAATMVENIGYEISKLIPKKKNPIIQNTKTYSNELREFFRKQKASVVEKKKILSYNHTFDYLFRDLGITVTGVVEEHHGESPSAGELKRIVDLIKKTDTKLLVYTPDSPKKIIHILAEETKIAFVPLDPIISGESFSPNQYKKIMQKNMSILNRKDL